MELANKYLNDKAKSLLTNRHLSTRPIINDIKCEALYLAELDIQCTTEEAISKLSSEVNTLADNGDLMGCFLPMSEITTEGSNNIHVVIFVFIPADRIEALGPKE
jgi:hypothetical protein